VGLKKILYTRFWNIIRAQITQLDKAKSWLKENGALLAQDI